MLKRLYGHYLQNLRIFREFQECGFDYILNPKTEELHRAVGGSLRGSHSLAFADLENFIGLSNIDSVPAHVFQDGTTLPVFDLATGLLLGEYRLNKCLHCFPSPPEE